MNKKEYMKPQMQAVTINIRHQLLNTSVNNVAGNASLNYGGGGSGPSRSRSFDDWDEDDEDE